MRAQFIPLLFLVACVCACSSKHVPRPAAKSEKEAAKPVATAPAYPDIRSIDFRNFDYPRIPGTTKTEIHLRDGIQKNPFAGGDSQFDGGEAVLGQVIYAYGQDLQPISLVVVDVNSGGNMTVSEIFLFGLVDQKPKLLWSFEAGDRAFGGLRTIYFEGDGNDNLILELFQGTGTPSCCATHFSRRFYNWRGGKLVELGRQEWIPLPKQPAGNRPN